MSGAFGILCEKFQIFFEPRTGKTPAGELCREKESTPPIWPVSGRR